MTTVELKAIIAGNAEAAKAMARPLDDTACANAINAMRIPYGSAQPAKVTTLGVFLALPDVLALSKIYDAANTPGSHTAARNAALLIVMMLESGFERTIEPNSSESQLLLGSLLQSGFITADHVAAWNLFCRAILTVTAVEIEAVRKA